jgi:hypothetical protein
MAIDDELRGGFRRTPVHVHGACASSHETRRRLGRSSVTLSKGAAIMSTTTYSAAGRRPATITAAVVLLGIMALLSVLAAPIGIGEDGASFAVISVAVGMIRLAAAFGVWRLNRWAAIVAFVITFLDMLLAAPGIFESTTTGMQVLSALAVPLDLATLIVLAWPSSRRAVA